MGLIVMNGIDIDIDQSAPVAHAIWSLKANLSRSISQNRVDQQQNKFFRCPFRLQQLLIQYCAAFIYVHAIKSGRVPV